MEEIALDNFAIGDNTSEYLNLLNEAEGLHQSALKITIDAFGEDNVQTAKHYGNLGRLYQSMTRYDVSMQSSKAFDFYYEYYSIVLIRFKFLSIRKPKSCTNVQSKSKVSCWEISIMR